MWTGRQTLEQIEGAIAKLHNDENALDAAMNSATQQAEQLRQQRAAAFRELARVKLDEMVAGRLVRSLDAAESHARQILESRRLRLSAVHQQRQTAVRELEQAESERQSAAAALEAALNDLEAIRVKAEENARATPQWVEAQKAFEAADAVAAEAEKKAAASEAELGAKKKPYDNDPLFSYLWKRGFGTQRYTAGNIVRLVDRQMAKFIGFTGARANYAMLVEIPQRLKEHAKSQRAKADERKAATAAIERDAMVALGAVEIERTLAEARHRVAAADETSEKKKSLLKEIDQRRDTLVAGTGDKTYNDALQTIADAD
ncbi:MAG: hypothetical protein AB7O43_22210, partial [Hyphomicrobiaceae bacterium]